MKKIIYLDNAATTRTKPEVAEAMLPYFTEYYGNPSSVYDFAASAKQAVLEARERSLPVLSALRHERFILPAAAQRLTIGLSRRQRMHTGKRGIILSPAGLSITRFCILANIWKSRDLK